MEIIESRTNAFIELENEFINFIDVSQKTKETYITALKNFNAYLRSREIKQPTREDIIAYRETMKEFLKPKTINLYLMAVKSFYGFLDYKGISKDITKNIKGIRISNKHLKRGLTQEEMQEIIKNCKNDRELLIIKLTANLGLRANELTNIRLEDFYKVGNSTMLKILGKDRDNIKQDSMKVDNRIVDLIQRYVQEYKIKDYLFVSMSDNGFGNKITNRSISRIVDRIFERAKINKDKISFHSIRHYTCNSLLQNGVSLQETSEYMRHKNIQTTMCYFDEIDNEKNKMSNIVADMLF